MIERTLSHLQEDFGTGTRVRCTMSGHEKRDGIVVMRDDSLGAWILWDDLSNPPHHPARDFIGLAPRPTEAEKSAQWKAAMDCESAGWIQDYIDPFDTGSAVDTGPREDD